MTIYPRCKSDFAQFYVTVDGSVMPCSWIGNGTDLIEYRKLIGPGVDRLNVKKRKLSEIAADPLFKKIEETWSSPQPFRVCQWMCASPCETKDPVGSNERREVRFSRRPKP